MATAGDALARAAQIVQEDRLGNGGTVASPDAKVLEFLIQHPGYYRADEIAHCLPLTPGVVKKSLAKLTADGLTITRSYQNREQWRIPAKNDAKAAIMPKASEREGMAWQESPSSRASEEPARPQMAT